MEQTKKETTWLDHPSADRTDRFPLDALLRGCGYRIAERRGQREPLWKKNGATIAQHFAEALLPKKEIDGVKKRVDDYFREVFR